MAGVPRPTPRTSLAVALDGLLRGDEVELIGGELVPHASPLHYWVLDPEHETLTVLRWADAAYLRVLDAGVGDVARAEPFEGVEISIAELFGREDEGDDSS